MSLIRSRRAASGVTLVELMIAVAIIGILAAIAYPSYQAQVRRGNRTDAKAELMEASQELEKCFTRYGVYNSDDCDAFDDATAGRLSEKGKYEITFGAVPNGSTPETGYLLLATLQPGRGLDPECGTLTLDHTGLRGRRDGTAPIQSCW